MAYFDCIINRIKAIDDLSENLYSLSLFGSYVRGDYIEGVSDLDFYAVFKEYTEESVNDITLIAEECTQGLKRRHVDVCWSLLEELDDPINKGFPFKILTVYQDDYKENHKLIYGNEIVDLIPSLNQREMIRIRAKSYHELAAQRIETTILKVISGEVIRYMALIHGALSIRKKETYRLMKELADDDALTILKEYHEGREMGHPDEFYYNFIETRSKKILEELDMGGTV